MNIESLLKRVGELGKSLRPKPNVLDEIYPLRDAIKMMTEKPREPSETYIE